MGALQFLVSRNVLEVLRSPVIGSALIFGFAGVAFVGATFLFSRYLPQETFGKTALSLALALGGAQAASAAGNSIIVRFDLATGLHALLICTVIAAFLASGVYVVGGLLYGFPASITAWMAACVVSGGAAMSVMPALQREHRFTAASWVSQAANIGLLVSGCFMAAGMGRTIHAPLVAVTAAYLVVAAMFSWRATASSGLRTLTFRRSHFRPALAFSGIAVANEVMAQVERLVLPLVLTFQDLATYALAAAVALAPFRMLEMATVTTLAPRLRAAQQPAERARILRWDIAILGAISAAGGVLLMLLGPAVCELLGAATPVGAGIIAAVVTSGFCRVLSAFAHGIAGAVRSREDLRNIQGIVLLAIAAAAGAGYLFRDFGLAVVTTAMAAGWLLRALGVLWIGSRRMAAGIES